MKSRTINNERGAILVIALIFVCVLAIAGSMAYQMTASELMIAKNFDASKEALYSANAGLEEARAALSLPTTNPPGINLKAIYDPATSYPDASWTAYILATSPWGFSDDPDYSSADTNYFPNSSSQTNTVITANSLQMDLNYWVKIRHKMDDGNFVYYGCEDPTANLTIEAFSSSTPTEYKPVDIITAYGIGEKSGSTIRAEVVHDPGPPILAALYAENDMDGDADHDGDGTLDLTINGDDNCAMATTTPSCSLCGVAPNRGNDIYVFSSDTTMEPMIVENNPSLSPDISTISGIGSPGSINLNVNQGITSLKVWVTGSTPSACYNTDYKICSSAGDLTITGQTGTGILLVEGNLTLNETNWDGLILVTGELTLNGGTPSGTSSGSTIEGAVLVNGKVWINDTNAGDVTINYNSCAIDAALSSIPLRILSVEDLSITQ